MSDEHIKVLRELRHDLSHFDGGPPNPRDMAALDAAIAALGGGWLPIESAPKDRELLLAVLEKRFCQFTVGCWDDDEEAWITDFRGEGNYHYVPATHWHELPSPPRRARRGDG